MSISLKYNMTLEYQMENSYGTKIYVDPIGRSAIKIDNHDIEFCQEVPASVQGDGSICYHYLMNLSITTNGKLRLTKTRE